MLHLRARLRAEDATARRRKRWGPSHCQTRQHIQTQVNALLVQRLVAAEDNPAHRRSPRIALTPAGARMIRRITDRERRFLARLDPPLDPQELAHARHTLATLRTAIGAVHEQQRSSRQAS